MRDGLSAKPITDNFPAVTADVLGTRNRRMVDFFPQGSVR
jgi:hypothetical protein